MALNLGLFSSAFDPFPHPGYLWAIEQAVKAYSLDGIIAAVYADPSIEHSYKRKPAMPLEDRLAMIGAVRWVKFAVVYHSEQEHLDIIRKLLPDVIIIGEDHRGKPFIEEALGIPIFWAQRKPGWSGTEFSERIAKAYLGTHPLLVASPDPEPEAVYLASGATTASHSAPDRKGA